MIAQNRDGVLNILSLQFRVNVAVLVDQLGGALCSAVDSFRGLLKSGLLCFYFFPNTVAIRSNPVEISCMFDWE